MQGFLPLLTLALLGASGNGESPGEPDDPWFAAGFARNRQEFLVMGRADELGAIESIARGRTTCGARTDAWLGRVYAGAIADAERHARSAGKPEEARQWMRYARMKIDGVSTDRQAPDCQAIRSARIGILDDADTLARGETLPDRQSPR